MPLCDHVALNHEIIRYYKLYLQPPPTRPTAAPRKTQQDQPASTKSNVSNAPSASTSPVPRPPPCETPLPTVSPSQMDTTPAPEKPKMPPILKLPVHSQPPGSDGPPPTFVDPINQKVMSKVAFDSTDDTKIQLTVSQLNQMLQARHLQVYEEQKRLAEKPKTTPIPSGSIFKATMASAPTKPPFESSDWYDTFTFSQSQAPKLATQIPSSMPSQSVCSPILPTSHLQPQPTTTLSLPVPRYHPSISSRPQWLVDIRKEIDDKILPSSLIWSCTSHYQTPDWAKVSHSAWSLYNLVDKTAPMSEAVRPRYTQMPHYRRIPADGLNHIHDFTVMFESQYNQERVTLKDRVQLYRSFLNAKSISLEKPNVTEMSFPSNIFSRFISQFYDIADTQLRPVQKTCYVLDYHVSYLIFISEGQNGLERLVRLAIHKGNLKGKMSPASITFPWVRMGSMLNAMREVLTDLQQQGLL